MDYRGKFILAPMVRVGTLPFRLLALRYGADLVYTEEIIDFKILQTTRSENRLLDTIDYTAPDGTVVFRTCAEEKGKVVFQMGTADADRAVQVAKFIENDVAAIDINMGCPKEYSTKGGMGAALLSNPENIKSILTSLVAAASVPVTCKIRILPELKDTLDLAKMIEATGVRALAVHGRLKEERPRHRNHDEVIQQISKSLTIPVIANGGSRDTIRFHDDLEFFRQLTGASSVMVARAAMWNPSIFSSGDPKESLQLVAEYLKLAVETDNNLQSSKYCVQQLLSDRTEIPEFRATLGAATLKEMCDVWNMSDVYGRMMSEREEKRHKLNASVEGPTNKRLKQDGADVCDEFTFIKKHFKQGRSPKQLLHEICKKRDWKESYETIEMKLEKKFYSTITVNGRKYSATNGDKNKRFAEQASASVCLRHLGLWSFEILGAT